MPFRKTENPAFQMSKMLTFKIYKIHYSNFQNIVLTAYETIFSKNSILKIENTFPTYRQ